MTRDRCRSRILALSGSLRAKSTNTALLEAARYLAPPDLDVVLYAGLDELPFFNPDLDDGERPLPPGPAALRAAVVTSDALVIACPEYAHGVPGAFKNALDWLVGGPEFPGKLFALFQATTRGDHVRSSLDEILTTMSGRRVTSACLALPLVGRDVTADQLAADPVVSHAIRRALASLAAALRPEITCQS